MAFYFPFREHLTVGKGSTPPYSGPSLATVLGALVPPTKNHHPLEISQFYLHIEVEATTAPSTQPLLCANNSRNRHFFLRLKTLFFLTLYILFIVVS
jgi:hypothetical protein